ncbi:hypothetical protein GCM10010266_54440 [Streptomyces griseomycini]|nr:hypothetical protein GCM10010266_54440 [Streptomyces griseomycini]GGR39090.1 hypothetical protein GCM10015536_51170 [Streptomyces griseomycini]
MATIHPNSGQVGPHKGNKCRKKGPYFGCIQSGVRQEFRILDQWIGGAFPNSTALNPMELPPPHLSRRGPRDERSVTDVTDGNDQPPATAGMMETPAPSGVAVCSPCSKRTSSSLT